MFKVISGILIALGMAGVFAQGCLLDRTKRDLALTQTELAQAHTDLAACKANYEAAARGRDALSRQAQNCLSREAAATAETEEWKQLFQDMTLREMTAQEKKEAPDEKTRDALFTALDAPL